MCFAERKEGTALVRVKVAYFFFLPETEVFREVVQC